MSKNKCIGCTLVLNKQIREYEAQGNQFTVEDLCKFSLKHDGICHRKTTYSSAGAEEHEAAKAARDLLFDKHGNPRDASTSVFLDVVVADNDTSGPQGLIKGQHDIIGEAADGKAEHHPDLGHTVKASNNEMFKLRDKDPSFRGRNLLSNSRIRSIQSDITAIIKEYHPHVGDDEKRDECLTQLRAIIHHHCNNHSCCKFEKFCSNLKVRNEHPDWSEEQIQEEALKLSKRHQSYMDLTDEGIEVLEKIILKRFNEKTIDRIAQCGCSNGCEGFWSQLVKFSEGKRIAGCGTDLWESMVKLCFCMNGKGNVEKSKKELAELLNVHFGSVEEKESQTAQRIRDKDFKRHSSERGKDARKKAKLRLDAQLNKDSRSKRHKSNKVPLARSCKTVTKHCTKCNQKGHTTRQCIIIKPNKQKHKTIRWKGILSTHKYEPRANKNKPVKYDWSKSLMFRGLK